MNQMRAYVRQAEEFLAAVDRGDACHVTRAVHRGIPIEIVLALRPDGKVQVHAGIINPVDGRPHSLFWMFDQPAARTTAVAVALRETCQLIERLIDHGGHAPTASHAAVSV